MYGIPAVSAFLSLRWHYPNQSQVEAIQLPLSLLDTQAPLFLFTFIILRFAPIAILIFFTI